MTTPTRTQETLDDYEKVAKRLHNNAARSRGISVSDLVPMAVVEDLWRRAEVFDIPNGSGKTPRPKPSGPVRAARKRGEPRNKEEHRVISRNTFKIYKAALVWYFEREIKNAETRLDREYLTTALHALQATPQTNYGKRGRHSSSLKQKKLPENDFTALMAALEGSTLQNHNCLRTMLLANRIVGLRPKEWEWAEVREASPGSQELVFKVTNAKRTNGRGNGEIRTLMLDQLDAAELDALHEMVRLVSAVQDGWMFNANGKMSTFDEWIHCLRDSLARVTAKLFPRRMLRPALYSQRHQMLADAKKGGATKAEVAALAGHKSEETAGRHYARKVSGERAPKVKASPGNITTVRSRTVAADPSRRSKEGLNNSRFPGDNSAT